VQPEICTGGLAFPRTVVDVHGDVEPGKARVADDSPSRAGDLKNVI
jgi:hypothetical protein